MSNNDQSARAGAWTGIPLSERLDNLMHAAQWDKDEVAFLKANLIRDIERCQAAAAPAVSAPAWQPIETAPKDGRDLLLWERDSSVPFVGAWRNGRRPGWHCDTEHYDTDGNACVVSNLWQEGVTHWMPLPTAPEIQCAATGDADGTR